MLNVFMLNNRKKAIAANTQAADATQDIHILNLGFTRLNDRDFSHSKKNQDQEILLEVKKYYKYSLRSIRRHFNVTFQV
jgi:hypothetical protein